MVKKLTRPISDGYIWVSDSHGQDFSMTKGEVIRTLFRLMGENPIREGLEETPERVLRSYQELFSGYAATEADIKKLCKTFEDGACDEMVICKGIQFSSFCEHHLLAFEGVAHVAYIPDGRVLGLSKFARLVEVYSRRLQIQERLTQQITGAIDKYLEPKGTACVIESAHSCMRCRGVKKQGSTMITSSLTGEFRNPEVRAEFFSLIKG